MNKVALRCTKDSSAKFLFASNRMYTELKIIKIFLYILNIIPVVICFLPQATEEIQLICSFISFALTLINEVTTSFLSNYKEKAILAHQLYEAEITGSTFSKTEYDRESTNDLNEQAIRKGIPKMKKVTEYPISYVPQDITDDYSYLYLCRTSAAKFRYVLSRLFYVHAFLLIVISLVFVSTTFLDYTTGKSLYFLVCLWPLIIPFIRNCAACKKCMRQCVKICADIDNFFADGDTSIERLARFYFYVQNIEFEMLLTRPVIPNFVNVLCSRGVKILTDGVTERFKDAILELKGKSLMNKGILAQPKGKGLITKIDYNYDDLAKLEKAKKTKTTIKTKDPIKSDVIETDSKPKASTKASTPKTKATTATKTTAAKEADTKPKATTKTEAKPKTSTASKTASTTKAKAAITKK